MTPISPNTPPSSPPTDAAVLQVSGLTKVYAKAVAPALYAVDLTVGGGEIFGLLGPNGAGKTTAIAIMSTLLRPSAGHVTICGWDIGERVHRVRRLIGVVPQNIALYDSLSARENLSYFGTLYGLTGSALRKAVAEGLAMAGLSERAHDPVKTLSGGMKRRINLAAGILHRPKVLLLDEPTVGVDAQSRNLIFENLLQLKNQGMTMIYTTHYFEEVELLCSRMAIIDHGRVLVSGPCSQLVADEADCANLSDLFLKLTGRQLRD
jgi:ABC-2 type transport system ATP-binding protein